MTVVMCLGCGRYLPRADAIAVRTDSPGDYYPTVEYVCRSCDRRVGRQ